MSKRNKNEIVNKKKGKVRLFIYTERKWNHLNTFSRRHHRHLVEFTCVTYWMVGKRVFGRSLMGTVFLHRRTLLAMTSILPNWALYDSIAEQTNCKWKKIWKKYSFMTNLCANQQLRDFCIQSVVIRQRRIQRARCYLCSSAAAQPLFRRQRNGKREKNSNIAVAQASIFVFSNKLWGKTLLREHSLTQTHTNAMHAIERFTHTWAHEQKNQRERVPSSPSALDFSLAGNQIVWSSWG